MGALKIAKNVDIEIIVTPDLDFGDIVVIFTLDNSMGVARKGAQQYDNGCDIQDNSFPTSCDMHCIPPLA
jgi:hypothetical protein